MNAMITVTVPTRVDILSNDALDALINQHGSRIIVEIYNRSAATGHTKLFHMVKPLAQELMLEEATKKIK